MRTNHFPLTLFYDASCPVCRLEMHALRERDLIANPDAPKLYLVDMSAPGFAAAQYGATLTEMNALIHAMRPDGSLVIGVEVFRLAYGAVGMGRWVAPTGWPGLKPAFDFAYAAFARHRYGFSRLMTPLIEWIERRRIDKAARRALVASKACEGGVCSISPKAHERSIL
jgi:predicted DCC family thiol-disulfide oxidoreductase YuxK